MLSAGDGLTDPIGTLGNWFIGLNENTADGVTPALCNYDSIYEPLRSNQEFYVYGPKYNVKDSWATTPPFACREWAWQLHDAERPYIDLTTYVHNHHPYTKSYPHGTYILSFIGWGTFERQKPLIGKHANTWYCLHECPKGESPGPIADIKDWTQANGWSAPKPPTRMPVFTDNPARRGKYPR